MSNPAERVFKEIAFAAFPSLGHGICWIDQDGKQQLAASNWQVARKRSKQSAVSSQQSALRIQRVRQGGWVWGLHLDHCLLCVAPAGALFSLNAFPALTPRFALLARDVPGYFHPRLTALTPASQQQDSTTKPTSGSCGGQASTPQNQQRQC